MKCCVDDTSVMNPVPTPPPTSKVPALPFGKHGQNQGKQQVDRCFGRVPLHPPASRASASLGDLGPMTAIFAAITSKQTEMEDSFRGGSLHCTCTNSPPFPPILPCCQTEETGPLRSTFLVSGPTISRFSIKNPKKVPISPRPPPFYLLFPISRMACLAPALYFEFLALIECAQENIRNVDGTMNAQHWAAQQLRWSVASAMCCPCNPATGREMWFLVDDTGTTVLLPEEPASALAHCQALHCKDKVLPRREAAGHDPLT